MIGVILVVTLLVVSTPSLAENTGDYDKLEKCLCEFYQGRPRDYPPKAKK